MPHFRVDDGLHNHPKARRAGLEAMGLWNVSGSYCMGYLTDGFVPEWYVKGWPRGLKLAAQLVDAGFWHPVELDGEKGWQFHEFTGPGRNDTRAQIEADRESARQRKANSRASQRQSRQASHRDTPRDGQGESARSPNPTQPNKKNSTHLESASPDSTEREPRSAPVTPTANRLVAETIPGGHPPAVLTELRLQASALLKAGQSEAEVAAALELWTTKTVHPKTLPALVSELINTRNRPATSAVNGQRTSTADRRVAEVQALKNNPSRLELT